MWGILFAAIAPRLRRDASYWLAALILGALVLPLVGWFVVAPLKGQPIAAGWVPSRMLLSVLINGAWGVGMAAIFAFLSRRSPLLPLGFLTPTYPADRRARDRERGASTARQ